MYNSEEHLKLKELRSKFSKKSEILDQIKAIDAIGDEYKLDVLIIDDDYINNIVFSKHLEKSDQINNITTKVCPIDAIDYLKELHEDSKTFPKVILLDIEMPLMNGLQFLEAFKNKFPRKRTKIILFTLHEKGLLKEELEYSRVIGHLPKPFDIKTFEKIIKKNFK